MVQIERERERERCWGLSGAYASPSVEHRGKPLICLDRDRAEMLYHDHPLLIKPYQIWVSELRSQEVSACKYVFSCQHIFCADKFTKGVFQFLFFPNELMI